MFEWSKNRGQGDEVPSQTPSMGRLAQIPGRGIYTEEARQQRLAFLERERGVLLREVGRTDLDPQRLFGNIENLVGAVQVPVGIAGPLVFDGMAAKGPIYLPMATTEGALVASVTRGATAISRSGGVVTRVIHQRMVRSPVFEFDSLSHAAAFVAWLAEHEAEIREQASRGSRHARLVRLEPSLLGSTVHVEFAYETGDAAGQNMSTLCTWQACKWIREQIERERTIGLRQFFIEGSLTGDKKLSLISFFKGRGTRVSAEAVLSDDTLRHVLKIEPETIMNGIHCGMVGAFLSGQIGFTINASNVVAAVFTACGQDIACVHESSLAILDLRREPGGIRFSLLMPCLVVGTIGGGTHLPQQRELLSMMGCTGRGSSARLAEIIAGFALALDLSTLAAVGTGQFAAAHESLGRKKDVQGLGLSDLSPAFFQEIMRDTLADPSLTVQEIEPRFDLKSGDSLITAVAARKLPWKLLGHFPLGVTFSRNNGVSEQVELLAKSKPTDEEVLQLSTSVARTCGGEVGELYARFGGKLGFGHCHLRELHIYRQTDPRFTAHAPRIYGLLEDPRREAYVVLMERLQNVILMDTAADPSGWQPAHIETMLLAIARIHAIWYGREPELRRLPWLDGGFCPARLQELTPLWRALGTHALHEFPEWYDEDLQRFHLGLIETIPEWAPELSAMPQTLIHNDFNPRNVGVRETASGLRGCVYDWELATIHAPQRDLAEFLAFVLPEDVDPRLVDHLVEFHRQALEEAVGRAIDPALWRHGYFLGLKDFIVNRQSLLFIAHTLRDCGFFPRLVRCSRHLHDLAAGRAGGALIRFPLAKPAGRSNLHLV